MTTDRPVAPTSAHDPQVRKAGLVMLGLFVAASVVFVCGGALALGVGAAELSEREAVQNSYIILPFMGSALVGLFTSIIAHFAVKKNMVAKIAIAPILAFFTLPCVLGSVVFFYDAIWPSL